MEQSWFEMPEIRRRTLANAVWIPLRCIDQMEETGEIGHMGYRGEFIGVGSVAIPLGQKAAAEMLGWSDVGISHDHRGYVQDGRYVPADVFEDRDVIGIHLVLAQRGNALESSEWHLHQDFVTTLGLKREQDVWVRPEEDYVPVARLFKKPDGSPRLIEVKASHLRDYLCARGMALYVTSYRSRVAILEDTSHIEWPENPYRVNDGMDHWEGRISEIVPGGMPYGSTTAVFHVARTDVDPEEDVPSFDFPQDDVVKSESWTVEHEGEKLYRIEGELWRSEWVDPAFSSPLVRRDEIPLDLLKFQVSSYSGLDRIDLGVYVTTTRRFQNHMATGHQQNWDGSLTFEKVKKYLPHFKSAIQVPIYVIGIDV